MEEKREGERERERDEGQIYPKIENKGRRMKTEDKNLKQRSHQPICLELINISRILIHWGFDWLRAGMTSEEDWAQRLTSHLGPQS